MSKFDLCWNDSLQNKAREDGWNLGIVVNSGDPISRAYLDVFQVGPKFVSRDVAAKHVLDSALKGSSLHINALTAIRESRTQPTPKGRK